MKNTINPLGIEAQRKHLNEKKETHVNNLTKREVKQRVLSMKTVVKHT
jgi:hypothetical protein